MLKHTAILALSLSFAAALGACDGSTATHDGSPDAAGPQPDARGPEAGPAADGPVPVTCPGEDRTPCLGTCNSKGACEVDRGYGPEVRIPAATVVMGARGAGPEADIPGAFWIEPERLATLTRSYFIDKFEVSVPRYRACVEAGACTRPMGEPSDAFSPCTYELTAHDDLWKREGLLGEHPVNCMSWYQAEAYCRWKGGRLPTDAEWTLAARGPASAPGQVCETNEDLAATDGRCNRRVFPWGNELDSHRANTGLGDGSPNQWRWRTYTTTPGGFFDGTLRVGTEASYQTHDGSSVYGVHDLAGNLAEKVFDWFDPAYEMNPRRAMIHRGLRLGPGRSARIKATVGLSR
jgi:formylglycine-generating enzyme required for sulfatase activity